MIYHQPSPLRDKSMPHKWTRLVTGAHALNKESGWGLANVYGPINAEDYEEAVTNLIEALTAYFANKNNASLAAVIGSFMYDLDDYRKNIKQ